MVCPILMICCTHTLPPAGLFLQIFRSSLRTATAASCWPAPNITTIYLSPSVITQQIQGLPLPPPSGNAIWRYSLASRAALLVPQASAGLALCAAVEFSIQHVRMGCCSWLLDLRATSGVLQVAQALCCRCGCPRLLQRGGSGKRSCGTQSGHRGRWLCKIPQESSPHPLGSLWPSLTLPGGGAHPELPHPAGEVLTRRAQVDGGKPRHRPSS